MARKPKWQEVFSANQRYGKWVVDDPCVIFKDGRGQSKVWAKCDCGNRRQVFCMYLANGKSKSCGCAVSEKGENHPAFKGFGDVSKTKYNDIVRGLTSGPSTFTNHDFRFVNGATIPTATITYTITEPVTVSVQNSTGTVGHNFQLSPELLNNQLKLQNYSCSVTSQPIDTGNATISCLNGASGYVSGNITWVHKDIKAMQGNMDMEKFVAMCRKVVDAADTVIVPPPKSENPVINAAQTIAEKYNGKKPR